MRILEVYNVHVCQARNMRIALIVLSLLSAIFSGCGGNGKIEKNLERIDGFCDVGSYDSAYSELKKINYEDLRSKDDRAFYNLMLTESALNLEIRLSGEDSLLDDCVRFYEESKDAKRLVRAYYNKGVSLVGKNELANGVLFLKKAEAVDKDLEISQMRFLINVNIAYANSLAGADKTGLRYAKRALAYAERLDNIQLKCFALNNIAMCFYCLGQKDSAGVYVNKIFPYLDDIKRDDDRAVLITNIGVVYYENKEYRKAEPLFRQALDLFPVSTTQINFAMTRCMLGDSAESDSLLKEAWPNASVEDKVEILQFRAEMADKAGDYAASSRFYKEAQALQDSVRRAMKTEEAVTVQHDYENTKYKESVGRGAIIASVAVLVVILLLVLSLTLYYRKRINKAKRTISEGNRLIAEYTARISELEKQDASHAGKVNDLKRKIRNLKDGQAVVLGNGLRLYDEIAAGGTTAMWSKKEFDEFIEYYRVGHAEAVAYAENGYRRLSSSNIFYLLLVDMGRDDADIQRTMCMTPGALRTMKSRINAKKVV